MVGGTHDGLFVWLRDGVPWIAFAGGITEEADKTISIRAVFYDRSTLELPPPTPAGVSYAFETIYTLRVENAVS